jgi:plasmid stability protein
VKNITVSVPDEVHRAARIAAAERGSSVSALVADYLRTLSSNERAAELARLARRRAEIIAALPYLSASENVDRDELHGRALR